MKSSMVVDLIRAHAAGSEDEFSTIVEAIAADEDKKGNSVLASDIRKAYRNMPIYREETDQQRMSFQHIGDIGSTENEYVEIITPEIELDDVILSPDLKRALNSLVEGHRQSDRLPDGIRPASRALMSGPPGCGKTMTAKAVARSLGLRLAYVRLDTVISMYMGKTGSNIGSVFDYAYRMGCVLFLDEFDAIARDRHLDDNGEAKRILSTILQCMDNLGRDTVVIAATNMPEAIDPAVVRRFDLHLEFPPPSEEGMKILIDRMMSRYLPGRGYNIRDIIDISGRTSYAHLETFMESAIREAILSGYEGPIDRSFLLGKGDEEPMKELVRMHESGIPLRRMEELTGIPRSTISYRLRRYYDSKE